MKTRKHSYKRILPPLLMIAVVVIAGILILTYTPEQQIQETPSNRPRYCTKDGCVPESVFEDLPPYPENFREIYTAVYLGILSRLENFSDKYPDEYYYLQPEFYGDAWGRNLDIYVKRNVFFVAGSGPYPGDVVITAKPGEKVEVITFWHAGYGVAKYQAFTLTVDYPREGKTRLGEFQVKQDPEEAKKCINVSGLPEFIFLEPSYPKFYKGWVRKLKFLVEISPECKPGKYLATLTPASLPKEKFEELYKEYGFKLSGMVAGGIFQIFVEVI